jgi:hypothetical protein
MEVKNYTPFQDFSKGMGKDQGKGDKGQGMADGKQTCMRVLPEWPKKKRGCLDPYFRCECDAWLVTTGDSHFGWILPGGIAHKSDCHLTSGRVYSTIMSCLSCAAGNSISP